VFSFLKCIGTNVHALEGNARLLTWFVGNLSSGVGQNFQQGCDVPAGEDKMVRLLNFMFADSMLSGH
jgi:hypothetical protein